MKFIQLFKVLGENLTESNIARENDPTSGTDIIKNGWLSTDGKLFLTNNHAQWAKGRVPNGDKMKPYEAESYLKNLGWYRLSIGRGDNYALFINGSHSPTMSQRKFLKELYELHKSLTVTGSLCLRDPLILGIPKVILKIFP